MAALALGALASSSPALAQTFDSPLIEATDVGFRVLFAVLVAVVVPVYLVKYGPANFLWFSDIGLLGICAALWLEPPLLGSMMALAVLLPETVWLVSFLTGAIAKDRGITTLAAYMFDTRISFFMRALSGAFHLALPPGALWRDRIALAVAYLFAFTVLFEITLALISGRAFDWSNIGAAGGTGALVLLVIIGAVSAPGGRHQAKHASWIPTPTRART